MELFKEAIRRVIWYFCEVTLIDGNIVCKAGTMKYRFFNWLYDNPEPYTDGWEYPN
jgi:hypothetical protein